MEKCMNTSCGRYDPEWENNCSSFSVMNHCEDFKPEQGQKSADDVRVGKETRIKQLNDLIHLDVQFGRPQECPLCGKNNPSGYKLPQDCMFCNDQDGTFKSPEPEKSISHNWCMMCGFRLAEKCYDYCEVCGDETMYDIEDVSEDDGYICEDCGKYPLSCADGKWIGDGGFYCWDCVGKDEQESNAEPGKSFAPKNHEQEGKAKMRLLPLDLLREYLIPAYEEGLEKYFEESWRLGFNISTMMDGLQRHMEEFYYKGEDLDHETLEKYGIEKTHLGAALFCILCMCQTMKNYPELDDRIGEKEWVKNKSRSIPGEPCNCPTATINGRDAEECEFFNMDNETCLYGKEEFGS